MYDGRSSILDVIEVAFGPRELLSQYVAFAEDAMRDIGVQLRICRDFHRLISLNERHRDSWPPLLPIFDPSYCPRLREDGFWIEGVDQSGDTVVTSAGRRYRSGDWSLAAELRSLRVFYDHPEPYVAAGGSVEVSAVSAARIFGDTMFSGALWVRPDYRRHGLTKIIPRLMRGFALAQWGTPTYWMMIAPELDRIGVTRAYGSWDVEPRVLMRLPTSRREIEGLFCSMSQATLIRDIAASVESYGSMTPNSRWSDTHMTKSSSFARHGSNTRS
jgi:hypothetical protein